MTTGSPPPPSPPLLALHAPGDRRGGRPWIDGVSASAWPGDVFAPDLPGHGNAEPPIGGNHESSDAAFVGSQVDTGTPPVVVGLGVSGWGAQLLALGGRACGLVLVDGLGGPWLDATQRVISTRRHLRDLVDDRAAMEPPEPGVPDARLDHLPPAHGDRDLAGRALAATTVPVLILSSRGSSLTPLDCRHLVDELDGDRAPIDVAEIADRDPATVMPVVATWWLDRRHETP